MPRQRAPQAGMATRRFGVEMEGYFDRYPRNVQIAGAGIKRDGSLYNNGWHSGRGKFGVEVTTRPIKTISIVDRIFSGMSGAGWSVDERAGTHVHIEIADFDEYDKLKLLRFGKGIERIIYMFVKDYRAGNRYAKFLPNAWRKTFKQPESHRLNDLVGQKNYGVTFQMLRNIGLSQAENSKYYWMNVYGSHRPTVEFRIFHAVESGAEAVKMVRLANAIVDTVKNSTIEQLEFLIMSLYESRTPLAIAKNLYYAIGLDYAEHGLPLVGVEAKKYMKEKLAKKPARSRKPVAV